MQAKKWYKSKTVWFGVLTMISGVASAGMDLLPILQISLDPLTYSYILFTLGVVSVTLRLITTTPIEKKIV